MLKRVTFPAELQKQSKQFYSFLGSWEGSGKQMWRKQARCSKDCSLDGVWQERYKWTVKLGVELPRVTCMVTTFL